MKCVQSDEYYYVWWQRQGRTGMAAMSLLCEGDKNFYQACSSLSVFLNAHHNMDLIPVSENFPCGYLCHKGESPQGKEGIYSTLDTVKDLNSQTLNIGRNNDYDCDGMASCFNTDLDEAYCEESADRECDGVCADFICEDESTCNGYSYGMWCNISQNYQTVEYTSPEKICDSTLRCKGERDESICQITNETEQSCRQKFTERMIPLYNFTRCSVLVERNIMLLSATTIMENFCSDYLDQTNCSDHSKVGLHCPIRGYMSTVAKQILCIDHSLFTKTFTIPPVCDDELDKKCVEVSLACKVHRHLLCDGRRDCEDGRDESHVTCQHMSGERCVRRHVSGGGEPEESAIPMLWVRDGVTDCWEGEDEAESWPQCGQGPTSRYKDHLNASCTEVFLCYGSDQFVVFSKLCDKVDTCSNENSICRQSRSLMPTFQKAFRVDLSRAALSYCLQGVESVGILDTNRCNTESFTISKREIFGENQSLAQIHMPSSVSDCRNFFGESYVFLSCSGRCSNSTRCPLYAPFNIKKYNSCPGQFSKGKVFTVDSQGNLTFLIKNAHTDMLSNDIFVCQNGSLCLTYDKVCNLVDDCGDGSDEASCDNHFQCESSKEYLHVSQLCDGVFHCTDMSDECNDTCTNTIIHDLWLKVVAWTIGILAVVLNFLAFLKSVATLLDSKSEAALISNSLVTLINVGDFLGGIYLTVLSSFDSYHGNKHCKLQPKWLTSSACIVLGITNTVGLQVSLFSMTALSAIRAVGIKQQMRTPRSITRRSILKAVSIVAFIILICLLFSCFPLLSAYEDYFVNGVKYSDTNTLFLGCPDKKKLTGILQEYYGRMQVGNKILSWSQITSLVREMFSEDYGGIQHRTLSFYGNDPVCVFKYFVRTDDPQRHFSLALLCVNILCFTVITTSYLIIAATSRKSVQALASQEAAGPGIADDRKKTDARLHRVVHAIIVSDFICWIPFTLLCWLHQFNVLDAKPWYPVFSLLVLPINSVVNPVLYNKSVTRTLDNLLLKFNSKCLEVFRRVEKLLKVSEHDPPSGLELAEVGMRPNTIDNSTSAQCTVSEQNKNNNNSVMLEQNKNSDNSIAAEQEQ